MRASCAEGTLRVQRITTYERDARGRTIVETDTGPFGGSRIVWRIDYVGDDMRPSRRTQFDADGRRRYEIRYSGGSEQSHIYYDEQGGVIGIKGSLP